MDHDFDEPVERRGTLSLKWDAVGRRYDVDPATCLPMWVADTDFRAPKVVRDALRAYADHGAYGYWGDYGPYREAIRWWLEARHGWQIDPDWILTAFGVVNAVALALEAYTEPGEGVVLFTPVYHAFDRIIRATGRRTVEVPLKIEDGRYVMDLDAARAALTGGERMVIFCSPHNPGGRVWTEAEIAGVADFAAEADLILISDEIHQDLVFPPHVHRATALTDGTAPRLVTMSSSSKAFNTPGFHTAHVVIEDTDLRRRLQSRMTSLGIATNSAGILAATAAYTPEGAAWIDAEVAYLDANRRAFDAGVNAIPGVRSMPLEATFLSWVDFRNTGMDQAEIEHRVLKRAGIAVNKGPTFGTGGDGWLRFNIGTQRAKIDEAVARLHDAFGDLQ